MRRRPSGCGSIGQPLSAVRRYATRPTGAVVGLHASAVSTAGISSAPTATYCSRHLAEARAAQPTDWIAAAGAQVVKATIDETLIEQVDKELNQQLKARP